MSKESIQNIKPGQQTIIKKLQNQIFSKVKELYRYTNFLLTQMLSEYYSSSSDMDPKPRIFHRVCVVSSTLMLLFWIPGSQTSKDTVLYPKVAISTDRTVFMRMNRTLVLKTHTNMHVAQNIWPCDNMSHDQKHHTTLMPNTNISSPYT
jgi:hypothetical protein